MSELIVPANSSQPADAPRPWVAVILAALLPMALSGCIAALPLVAGGAILRGQTGGKAGPVVEGAEADTRGFGRSAARDAPGNTSGLAIPARASAGGGAAYTSGLAAEPPSGLAIRSERLAAAPPPSELAGKLTIVEGLTALPPPDRDAPGEAGARAALRAFAEQRLAQAEPGPSALLASPASLQPERMPCRTGPPAILIDLDPTGALAPLEPPPAGVRSSLAQTLATLRRQGLTIAWITDRGPTQARAIRAALAAAGLDPEGIDPLLVQRFPGETKQPRRRALGAAHCVLAIAGDSREDFDDLYVYLREPNAAFALETLIGESWFLIENPL